MALLTPAQLADAILHLQLLDGEARDRLPHLAGSFQDARDLAQDLLRRDWLTAYQINQLFLGRGKELVLGPYVSLERLGEGGMGQVFKAWQRSLNRIVALKVIRRECVNNVKLMKRFEREMQALGQMRHPNIVHAYDADQVDGVCFIAMEYIEGIDLNRLVRQSGPLMVKQACDYIRQAALGLQHAHEQGFVHRDIKPANLFLTRPPAHPSGEQPRPGHQRLSGQHARPGSLNTLPSIAPRSGLVSRPSGLSPRPDPTCPWGLVKVLDLGLARFTGDDNGRTNLTQLGSVMGTPDFIAPEQARDSSACDIRADLYSLGCTLYFLLTGQPPFPTGTLTDKLLSHQNERAEPVAEARRRRLLDPAWIKQCGKPTSELLQVTPAVDELLQCLMAKKPDDRLETPEELAARLAEIIKGAPAKRKSRPATRSHSSPHTACADRPCVEPRSSPQGPTLIVTPELKPPVRKMRRRIAAATLGVALLSGMLLAAVSTQRPEASPSREVEKKELQLDEAAFKELETRVHERKGDVRELRKEIARFQAAHYAGPLALEANRLFAELPSALDRIDRAKMEKFPRFDWQPAELVALIGPPWKLGAGEARPFQALAFSPDGSWLLAGGEEAPLRLWSTESFLMPLKVFGPVSRTTPLTFSLDGSVFVSGGGDGVIRLWDAAARTQKLMLERQPRAILALAYHPGGARLATGCGDGKIRLWDTTSGKQVAAWEAGTDAPVSLAFSGDGKHLFWPVASEVRYVDLANPALAHTAAHKHGPLRKLVIQPGGACLVGVGADGSVTQWSWDGMSLRETASEKAHGKSVLDVAWAPDGAKFISVGLDGLIHLWDSASFKTVKTWELPEAVFAVAFAPDGRHFATANGNGTIGIFRLAPTALARKS